jgi:hypothetical protein
VRHSKPSAYRGNATHENFDGANFFSIQIDSPLTSGEVGKAMVATLLLFRGSIAQINLVS